MQSGFIRLPIHESASPCPNFYNLDTANAVDDLENRTGGIDICVLLEPADQSAQREPPNVAGCTLENLQAAS